MVTCQSANQLKTPAKVSWAFKTVSQFGSLGYTIMGKTADLTVVQKTIIDTLHKEGFFDSGLQLICIFWSLVSQILYGVQVQLFHDILIYWDAPVYLRKICYVYILKIFIYNINYMNINIYMEINVNVF